MAHRVIFAGDERTKVLAFANRTVGIIMHN